MGIKQRNFWGGVKEEWKESERELKGSEKTIGLGAEWDASLKFREIRGTKRSENEEETPPIVPLTSPSIPFVKFVKFVDYFSYNSVKSVGLKEGAWGGTPLIVPLTSLHSPLILLMTSMFWIFEKNTKNFDF